MWAFVQELNKIPEKYLPDRVVEASQNDDHLSDSGSWGTDFEDEMSEENAHFKDTHEIIKPSQIKSRQISLQNNITSRIPTRPPKRMVKPEEEETYANCESCQDEEKTYANFQDMAPPPLRNVSRLHSQIEKTLAEKLKEELKRRNEKPTKKPAIGPKPETLPTRKISMTASDKKFPQKSFLHNAPKAPNQRTSNDTRS